MAVEHPSKKHIWAYAQNKPSLVADDLETYGVPREAVHAALLRRGVYKWLAVRRDLIRYKDVLKREIRGLNEHIRTLPRKSVERRVMAARLKALEEVRAAIRQMTHSERWRAPDNDREAARLLVIWDDEAKPEVRP